MRKNRLAVLALIAALIAVSSTRTIAGQAQSNQANADPNAASVLSVLEKSGYSYTKISDGVWEIPATGKNLKEFPLRVIMADDLVLVIARLTDRKALALKDALLVKLLELNHHFDTAKLALSDDLLYARIDTQVRHLDGEQLKYMIQQVANVVDETYPQIKQYIADAK